ncbi:MAG TPA: hypothetical protein VL137_18690 [Polyangiaceae bacterium]|nr:hypothetical protein [Polyangiaceae bacterium]
MSLQRLLDDPEADLNEIALLRAGKADGMSEETRRKVLAGIGVGGALVGLSAVSTQAGKAVWPMWLKSGLLLSVLGGIAATVGFFGFGSHSASVPSASSPVVISKATSAVPTKVDSQSQGPEVRGPGVPVYQASDLPLAPSGSASQPTANRRVAGAAAPGDTASAAATGAKPASVLPAPVLPAPAAGNLTAELAALNVAKTQLATGDAASALRTVQQYRTAFPQGKLAPEATVVEVEALLALGKKAQAATVAGPLLKSDSPYAARLRSLLGQN